MGVVPHEIQNKRGYAEGDRFLSAGDMPIASSQYWNSIHGREKGEADMDEEGKQTMRTLARNMTFLMLIDNIVKDAFPELTAPSAGDAAPDIHIADLHRFGLNALRLKNFFHFFDGERSVAVYPRHEIEL